MKKKPVLFLLFLLPRLLGGQPLSPNLLEDVPDTIGEVKDQSPPSSIQSGPGYTHKWINFHGLALATGNYQDQYAAEVSAVKTFTTEINFILQIKPAPLFQWHLDAGGKTYAKSDNQEAKPPTDHFVTHEAYFSSQLENFSLNLGKKRMILGLGSLIEPLDILNPQKALPGQPLQKEGKYLISLHFTKLFDNKYISQVFTDLVCYPEATQDTNGLPRNVNFENSSYLLKSGGVFKAHEITLYYLYRFKKNWLGISYAHYIWSNLEAHAESLAFFSRKPYLRSLYSEPSKKFYHNTLLGIKYTLLSKMILGLDYFYQSDGLSQSEWDNGTDSDFVRELTFLYLARQGESYGRMLHLTTQRHYFLGSLAYPNFLDYFNLNFSVIVSPEDSASLFLPKIDYLPSANTSLGAGALFLAGKSGNHYESLGFDYMLFFDLNISF